MSLELRIKALAETIATQMKNLKTKQGDLSLLTTTEKNTIVGAINELVSQFGTLDSDITTRINSAIATALEGEDLSDLANQVLALIQADNGLVSAIAPQSFSELQKNQARENIGAVALNDVGNTDRDFIEDFNAIYNT